MHKEHSNDKTMLGFWIYIMTDLTMFAALFAAFAVLRNSTFGGITMREMFNGPFVLTETFLLLISSFTCGLGLIAAKVKNIKNTLILFSITFLLGFGFLGMELFEFSHLIADGSSFQTSAFLSSFFSLVGTHGLHIFAGLVWIAILLIKIYKTGIADSDIRKLTLLSIFWHFLDVVWIFIFTVVYLMGGSL